MNIKLCLLIACLGLSTISEAKITKIKFAKGSYCGSYSGNFSKGKVFSLYLSANQEFITRNTGDGFQYDITVKAPNGRSLRGEHISDSELMYTTTRKGRHIIKVKSTERFNSIEFCAY